MILPSSSLSMTGNGSTTCRQDAGGGSARLQPALSHDGARVHVEHTDLAREDDEAVLRDPVARRTQSVAVEHRADDRAVSERDTRRAVPWLHEGRVELVERAALGIHLGV